MRRLQRLPTLRPAQPSVQTALAATGQSALGEVGDIWQDVSTLAQKAPGVISYVVKIVNKAEPYLPQIAEIIDKAGTQLPTVLRVISKVEPYLPTITKVIDKVEPHIPTIMAVAEDPALPQVISRVQVIQQMEEAAAAKKAPKVPAAPGAAPAKPKTVGVGLHRVVPALDAYIYARKHPWVPWVAGGGLVLLLVGVGFGIGRATAPGRRAAKEERRSAAGLSPAPAVAGRRRYARRRRS